MQRQLVGSDDIETDAGVQEVSGEPIDRATVRVTIDIDGRRLVYEESDLGDLSIDW